MKLRLLFCSGFAFGLLFGVAWNAAAKTKAFVPQRCMGKITIHDFSKPCKPMKDGIHAICDGVLIRFSCVEYRDEK